MTSTFGGLVTKFPNLKFFAAEYGPLQREINDVEFAPLGKAEFQFLSKILETLIVSGDEAVALQRYKASIKNDSKVA